MSSACCASDDGPATVMLRVQPRRSGATSEISGASARNQFHSRQLLLTPWIASTGSVPAGSTSTESSPPRTGTERNTDLSLRCR